MVDIREREFNLQNFNLLLDNLNECLKCFEVWSISIYYSVQLVILVFIKVTFFFLFWRISIQPNDKYIIPLWKYRRYFNHNLKSKFSQHTFSLYMREKVKEIISQTFKPFSVYFNNDNK